MLHCGILSTETYIVVDDNATSCHINTRSCLKKVFSPDIGVEPSYQVLDILEYACGLILGLALISTENSNFETASRWPLTCRFPLSVRRSVFRVQDLSAEHRTLNTFIKDSVWVKRIKKKAEP